MVMDHMEQMMIHTLIQKHWIEGFICTAHVRGNFMEINGIKMENYKQNQYFKDLLNVPNILLKIIIQVERN